MIIVLEHFVLLLVMALKALIADIPEAVVKQSIDAEKILQLITDPE